MKLLNNQVEHRGIILTKITIGKTAGLFFRLRPHAKNPGKFYKQYFKEIFCSNCHKPSYTSNAFDCSTRTKKTSHHFCTHECKIKFFTGENHPGWKGGFNTTRGHKHIRCDDHPRSKFGYIAEHILIAEKKIGRRVRKNEVVHHIDADKSNNSPENLDVMSRKKHSSAHQSINGILKGLIGAGIVWFDTKFKKYKSKYGEIEVYGKKENMRARRWRKRWFAKHGFSYRKISGGSVCSVASSYSKTLG